MRLIEWRDISYGEVSHAEAASGIPPHCRKFACPKGRGEETIGVWLRARSADIINAREKRACTPSSGACKSFV
jgi:hypothetical protein